MALTINTNTVAFEAMRNLELTTADFMQAVRRLSSGLRINSAADDPAGLAIASRLLSQVNGFDQVQRNMQDAVSLLQVAEAGLDQTMTALQRMNQLALQASNGTLSASDRQTIQLEVVGLIGEIDQVASQTQYNSRSLLNGSAGGAVVSGGGPDVTNLVVQAGVTIAGTYTVTAVTSATQAVITGAVATNATMQGVGSITITGPTGASQTFTSYAGEAVSTFVQQVNDSGLGVTLAVNSGSGAYEITSNLYGVNGTGNNGVVNTNGPTLITATGNAADVDFGTGAGAGMGLTGVAATTPDNASITLTAPSAGVVIIDATGSNTDTFVGTGEAVGISFKAPTPGALVGGDEFTVSQNAALQFQAGAGVGGSIGLSIGSQGTQALGVNALDLTTQAGAEAAISTTQNAINQLSATRANLGALQNRLSRTETNAGATQQQLLTAHSNIMDADIAAESIRFTRDQILLQAGTAMLAQASQLPLLLLSLLSPPGFPR